MKVSIFESFAGLGREVPLSYVFDKIKNGGDFVTTIDQIRMLTSQGNTTEADKLKKSLPGITFCGVFTERKSNKLIKATGLVILDFDEKGTTKEQVINEYIFACWASPRGGLKALVKIPEVKTDKEFKSYFYSIQKTFPDIDPSGKDISRFCFISYDPEIYINEDSKLFTDKISEDSSSKEIPLTKNIKTDFKKLSVGINMIDGCDVGNRNNTILKAGRLIGGYIASGEVNELDALDICERAVYAKDPEDYKANWKTFQQGIDYGKREPLTSNEIKELSTENKLGKIDYSIEDSINLIDEIYENGFTKGYSTGWKHFDEYYSIRLGFTTYIYGSPFAGKTKWLFNLLINTSRLHGLKHLIYSPETGGKEDVYSQLIQIYAQGDITNTFANQISKEKFKEAKDFIGRHFIVISTDETHNDLTPNDLIDYVDIVEKKYNTKIHTITIDPWNELKHDNKIGRSDLYLNEVLKLIRVNARKKERHIFIITHIQVQKAIGIDDLGTQIFPFPVPENIAEGQSWYRKGFMMLSFYRHFIKEGFDSVKIGKDRTFEKNQLLIRVQKYKPEGSGKRGEIEFRYDAKRHTFTGPFNEQPDQQPLLNFYEVDEEPPF